MTDCTDASADYWFISLCHAFTPGCHVPRYVIIISDKGDISDFATWILNDHYATGYSPDLWALNLILNYIATQDLREMLNAIFDYAWVGTYAAISAEKRYATYFGWDAGLIFIYWVRPFLDIDYLLTAIIAADSHAFRRRYAHYHYFAYRFILARHLLLPPFLGDLRHYADS